MEGPLQLYLSRSQRAMPSRWEFDESEGECQKKDSSWELMFFRKEFLGVGDQIFSSSGGVIMNKTFCIILSMILFLVCFLSAQAGAADEGFAVMNQYSEEVFSVNELGNVAAEGFLFANGATAWGGASFVLGQDAFNRGIVITDKAASNPNNIYFGWNVGSTHDYAEIFALQEGVDYKDLILNPSGDGFVGIGITNPSHPLEMGSGAYVSQGGVWTNASSREYKTDIEELTAKNAMNAFIQLRPVEFTYITDKEERHVGFIAEDVPALMASKDKKGMSPMDVVAVLTKVVQEQQKIVLEQQTAISELSKRLAAIEKGTQTEGNEE